MKRNERLEAALRYLAQDGHASPRALDAISDAIDDEGTATYETCLKFSERMKQAIDPRQVHRELVDDATVMLRKLEDIYAAP